MRDEGAVPSATWPLPPETERTKDGPSDATASAMSSGTARSDTHRMRCSVLATDRIA